MALNIEEILADGHIDIEETAAIRAEIFGADGDGGTEVTEGELRTVFTLKDGADSYVREFGQLVADAMVAYALEDADTPGVVDAAEASVLNELVGADGLTDEWEELGIATIRAQAVSVHPTLMTV